MIYTYCYVLSIIMYLVRSVSSTWFTCIHNILINVGASTLPFKPFVLPDTFTVNCVAGKLCKVLHMHRRSCQFASYGEIMGCQVSCTDATFFAPIESVGLTEVDCLNSAVSSLHHLGPVRLHRPQTSAAAAAAAGPPPPRLFRSGELMASPASRASLEFLVGRRRRQTAICDRFRPSPELK